MSKGRTRTLCWLCKNAVPVLWQIFILAFLGIAISYISVRFALASRDLLDCATGDFAGSFYDCVVAIAVLLVLDILVQSVYNILSVRLGALYKNSLQRKLFSGILGSDFSSLGEYHSGEIINRLTKDVGVVSSNIITLVPTVAILVSGVAMSFWELFRIDYQLALICIAIGPFVVAGSILYGRKVKTLHKNCLRSDGRILSFMQESIQNLLVIKAFRRERQFDFNTGELQRQNYKLNMRVGYASLAVNVLYFLAMTAAYYFSVAWCAYKIHLGIMTVGSFAAIIQLVGSIQTPFRQISGSLSSFFATYASAERIIELEDMKKDCAEDRHIEDFDSIEVERLAFAYEEEEVLRDVSFRMNKGDIIAVTGASGNGKSTLIKVLLGIYEPLRGSMHIYNKEEKIPISSDTRSAFCYVPQGNMIISGTIGENIAFFDDAPEYERIRDAARCACILDYIDSLPEGFDTVLGEGGLGLSEGQTQRLAIARAIYADSPIILLDEATSALDEDTEASILRNISTLRDKSCIIITHRPAALEVADKNLKLKDGISATE